MKTMTRLLLLSTLLCPLPLNAHAADSDEPTDQPPAKSPLTFSLFAGDFSGDNNPGALRRNSGGYGYGLTVGWAIVKHVSLEGEFIWFRREYERISDTVIPDTANNDQRMLTLGLSALARVEHRIGKWRPFVAAGAGYFDTELWVTDPDSGLFTRDGAPSSASSVGYHLAAGIGFRIHDRWDLEIGWKQLILQEDFAQFSNGEVDLGGGLLYISARGGGL